MPTFRLRRVGMSYLIDHLGDSSLDPKKLGADLERAFGAYGVASMEVVLEPGGDDPASRSAAPALLIDAKCAGWDKLREWLEAWVGLQGFAYVSWSGGLDESGGATLHVH